MPGRNIILFITPMEHLIKLFFATGGQGGPGSEKQLDHGYVIRGLKILVKIYCNLLKYWFIC